VKSPADTPFCRYVSRKLHKNGEASLSIDDRRRLVELATSHHPWLGWEVREGDSIDALRRRFPKLRFDHFVMNGADDVVRHAKWRLASPTRRFLTMGRPGATEAVREGMLAAGLALDDPNFVLGPELPDISSSEARRALAAGDVRTAGEMLDPQVLAWCVKSGPWRPPEGAVQRAGR